MFKEVAEEILRLEDMARCLPLCISRPELWPTALATGDGHAGRMFVARRRNRARSLSVCCQGGFPPTTDIKYSEEKDP
jgi:hypothetical protein